MPLHDAQEDMSSLRTPLSCGYSGELLGLEFWARRPSQRIIFLYSQPLKSRGHFPVLTGLRTKVWCDLALWGAGGRSPGWFWAQRQQQGLPGCQLWHLGARVAEQPWLPWGGRSQPGRGKHHSAMPVICLIPPRRNKTGQKSHLRDVQQWGVWRCSPSFLPVLLPGFATPERGQETPAQHLTGGREFPSQHLTGAVPGSGAGM